MTLPTSREAYEDCYAILDAALDSRNGVRYPMSTESKARHLINRLNYSRRLDRELNEEIHEPGDPKHGVSVYDGLTIRLPKEDNGHWWIYIERRGIDMKKLEEL